MAGPAQTSTLEFVVPPGEAQVLYSPRVLAQKIQNFELTTDGTLKSVVGPAVYEPARLSVHGFAPITFGTMHGVFHAGLLGGIADTLLVRSGSTLYRHTGWDRTYESIYTGLSDEHRPLYPDQFVVLGSTIVWTNGVDRALSINHDGMVTPLGFDSLPPTPFGEGPQGIPPENRATHYANTYGYTWPGKIGTVGDLLDGQTGALLSGGWYYYVQWEDIFGNLSQPSAPSNLVYVNTVQSDPYETPGVFDPLSQAATISTEIDDLTRQFLVRVEGDAPDHCVAMNLYRTPDVKHVDVMPRLLARIPNNRQFFYPDNIPDSALGPQMLDTISVPVFRIMCTHQGCLVIGNTLEDPGVVMRSQVGLPGTFSKFDFIYPDSGGSEVTGLASHAGKLLAFTESSVYELVDFTTPVPLAQGIGCVAPRSIKALPSGLLIWLGRDGFYGMSPTGAIQLLSMGIDRTVRNFINRGRARTAVAVIDPVSTEYQCAVSPAGESDQTLVLTFDGTSWKRQQLGIHIADWCQTDDYRQYVICAGKDTTKDTTSKQTPNNVFVMGHETSAYDPPSRDMIYRSGWLRGDKVGLTPLHIRTMYIGMKDSWNGDFSIRFYRNGSWSEVITMIDVRAVGTDDGSEIVNDIAGSAVIGTAKTHDPRLFFRQIPVGLETTSTWAFEISATSPTRLNIASFVFDITVATQGNPRSRTPFRDDI